GVFSGEGIGQRQGKTGGRARAPKGGGGASVQRSPAVFPGRRGRGGLLEIGGFRSSEQRQRLEDPCVLHGRPVGVGGVSSRGRTAQRVRGAGAAVAQQRSVGLEKSSDARSRSGREVGGNRGTSL